MNNKIKITYITNSGLMISCGSKKILVDALFTGKISPWSAIPEITMQQIQNGIGPFDGISLALATHKHPDHFSNDAIKRMKDKNIDIITPDTIKSNFTKRSAGKPITLVREKNCKILAYETMHDGYDEMEPITHFCYLIDFNGEKILIMGDAFTENEKFKKWVMNEHIDTICINFVELNQEKGRKFIKDTVQANNVILYHLPLPEDDQYNFRKMTEKNIAKYKAVMPKMYLCADSMESFYINYDSESSESRSTDRLFTKLSGLSA